MLQGVSDAQVVFSLGQNCAVVAEPLPGCQVYLVVNNGAAGGAPQATLTSPQQCTGSNGIAYAFTALTVSGAGGTTAPIAFSLYNVFGFATDGGTCTTSLEVGDLCSSTRTMPCGTF